MYPEEIHFIKEYLNKLKQNKLKRTEMQWKVCGVVHNDILKGYTEIKQ